MGEGDACGPGSPTSISASLRLAEDLRQVSDPYRGRPLTAPRRS